MGIERNRDRFEVKGGGLVKTHILASGGSYTSMLDLGFLEESGLTINRKMVEYEHEDGTIVNVISGGKDWRFKTVLQQVGIDEINLAMEDSSIYRHLYYYVALANGNFQEFYIPLVKIISNLELSFKANTKRLISLEFQAIMSKGAVSVTPAGLSVPANSYGVIVEGSTALGQVTTSSGTIYTAAV